MVTEELIADATEKSWALVVDAFPHLKNSLQPELLHDVFTIGFAMGGCYESSDGDMRIMLAFVERILKGKTNG